MQKPVALTVAGSDSSAGAGIQADLRMFSALGVFGTTAITALTAQNPSRVTDVVGMEAGFLTAQMHAVLEAFPVAAMKTGMLWSREIISAVAELLESTPNLPCVVDPVMIATSGAKLVADEAIETYCHSLFPRAALMTPNIDEAQVLLEGQAIDAEQQGEAAEALSERYGCPVLLKGGHLAGDLVDLLFEDGEVYRWSNPRLDGVNTHGSGCTLSAAITAYLAHGVSLKNAVEGGLGAVHRALAHSVSPAPGLSLAGLEEVERSRF